jgi:sulfate adenylyltransferase
MRAVAEPRPASPLLCPSDRTVADVRLSLLGARLPFAVLGDLAVGEPPGVGRIRVPADPDDIEKALAGDELVIGDSESTPLAVLTELTTTPGASWIEGRLRPVDDAGLGLPVREGDTRVVVAPARPLTTSDVEQVRAAGTDEVLVLLPTAGVSPDGIPVPVLERCLRDAAPVDFTLVPVPVSWRGTPADEALAESLATAMHGTYLFRPRSAAEQGNREDKYGPGVRSLPGAATGDVLWTDVLTSLHEATSCTVTPEDAVLARVLPILSRWRPPRRRRGLVVFFTGLSGSGKSTLARALVGHLIAHSSRTVTLLDGDLVRRMLSSGLGFDRAGRDLNVRRIGFVAAEVARHGGIAVCAPIAPYAESRAAVRQLVEAVGDLVLIHVSTPLEECERRDVKGLYRKARAGIVTQFTGISDPYDEPEDADLRVDTSSVSLDVSLAGIVGHLRAGGWLSPEVPADAG